MYTPNDFYTISNCILPLLMFSIFFGKSENVHDVCVFIFLMAIVILSYNAYIETLNCNLCKIYLITNIICYNSTINIS
jgi:hypothetical protein